MKTGRAEVKGFWALMVCAAILVLAAPVIAQTPNPACAADSLYLISPPVLNLNLQVEYPRGMEISWSNLDLTQATCYSLTDTLGLGFHVEVSGGFGDKVDRVFQFSTLSEGTIGAAQPDPLVFTWHHQGPSTFGSFEGLLNLANNGGIWRYRAAENQWEQVNKGLPMYWKQVNVVALAEGPDGVLIAGMTKGQSLAADPAGLFVYHGDTWAQMAPDLFDDQVLITKIVVSPTDSDHFLVGTRRSGLFVTRDGGFTFANWTTELDPGIDPQPTQFYVRALDWLGDKIFMYVDNFGVFSSSDGGNSFSRLDLTVPSDLDSSEPTPILPVVNAFSSAPGTSNRIFASLQFHGVYESEDSGSTWHDLYGDLIVPDPEVSGVWVNSAIAALADPSDEGVILMAISQKGIFRTSDGGETWAEVADNVQPESRANLTRTTMLTMVGFPGLIYVVEDGFGILKSNDFGVTWESFPNPPVLDSGYLLLDSSSGGGDLVFGSYNGGIYESGTALALANTYSAGTSVELRDLDLGLQVSFTAGSVEPGDHFGLTCQTFQGWAVWRAPGSDRMHPTLVGLYDRVNPESCLEGYCGDPNVQIIPQCFAAKRAACFDATDLDTLRFFDAEVFNGFDYYYSVSTFDYGNTALTTAENNTNEMLFSPRWPGDSLSIFNGAGNQSYVQVNLGAAPDVGGDEIYVFPNPLRPGAGIPGEEGRTVVFKNLPEGALVRIFTTAGDDVMVLGTENLRGGQMYWTTENRERESVAPGVYLYKVEMPHREDFWGRLVVIR